MTTSADSTPRADMVGRGAEAALDHPARYLAAPAWIGLRLATWLRHRAFERGLLPITSVAVPVISVGNIALGGTGKTPVVAAIGDLLAARDLRPQVLMRGYHGQGDANDEARSLDLPVVCHPKRVLGAATAIANGAGSLILDDGFQHRYLARDLDLVCLDATRPWGRDDGKRGLTLPLGWLREHPRALRRADGVVLTRCDQASAERVDHLMRACATLGLPVIRCCHAPTALTDLSGATETAPNTLAGRRVIAVSGIGQPAAFARTLVGLGATVIRSQALPDHHHYTAADCAQITELANEHQAEVVTTSKDAVKLAELLGPHSTWRVVHVAAEFAAGDRAVLDGWLTHAIATAGDRNR